MARFKPGDPKIAGRKKGTPNKTTAAIKEIIGTAFDELGGLERLVAWATRSQRNLGAFYTKIWVKIIPTTITGAIGVGPLDPTELNAMRSAMLEIAANRRALEVSPDTFRRTDPTPGSQRGQRGPNGDQEPTDAVVERRA